MRLHVQVGGLYQCRVRHGDGRPDTVTPWFDNLITNVGLDLIGTGFSARLWVGTGATAPAVTDTSLAGAILGSTTFGSSSLSAQLSSQPYYWFSRYVATFAVGGVVGTMREVGIGAGTAGAITSLFSRSRLKDAYGNDYNLTLTATDQLEVTYELRNYIPVWNSAADDVISSMEISGITQTVAGRPVAISRGNGPWGASLGGTLNVTGGSPPAVFSGALVAPTAGFTHTGYVTTTQYTNDAYVPGSYRRTFTMTWTPQKGNITVNGCYFTADRVWSYLGCGYQFSFSPGVSKTDLQTLTLTGYFSWGRYS